MPSKTSLLKLLLVGASCAVIAACSDSSISSPGEQNQVPPPSNGDNGGTAAINLLPAGGCATGTQSRTFTIAARQVTGCRITGDILSDLTLTADGVYFIDGPVFIGEDLGPDVANPLSSGSAGSLNIPAGATIAGASGNDYIVVARGSKINALGTQNDPIVFTSAADIIATKTNTPRDGDNTARGEWGGLVINGRAPINACIDGSAVGGSQDCEKSGEGSSGLFGGDNVADNSGTLQYVQVRYAGFEVNNEDELNGIAFQGVGNGTTVDHIQVHNNFDDGVEFFGGTVNAKYLVMTGNRDDNIDYTDGYTGSLQFIVVTQRGDAGSKDPRGFEMDNLDGGNDSLPRSNARIANFTLIGVADSVDSDEGILLRRGTAGHFLNGIVVDFNKGCFDVDSDATKAQFDGGNLIVDSVFIDCGAGKSFTDTDGFGEAVFAGGAHNVDGAGTNTMEGIFSGSVEQAVAATNPTTMGAFFTATDYIGAFAPTEGPAGSWASGWTFGLLPDPGCPSGTIDVNETLNGQRVCQLRGEVTTNVRLARGNIYELFGPVFVGKDMGADPANPVAGGVAATLTVDSGVTVFGATGNDYIVISRGSKLNSNGSATAPVIWTSQADIEGKTNNTSRGQWGGIVINGRAPINACIDGSATGGTTACEKSGEGSSGLFGGATTNDDSGKIRYTRVQFAGFEVNNEDELNGVAFQGVGNATLVDYLQVHNNFDDGVEFFGGTVNAKHLVLTGNRDDNVDYTDGYTGMIQYVIVQQAGDAGSKDPRGFEMDNLDGGNDSLPRSNARVANFTVIGVRDSADSDEGIMLRRGTAGRFVNGLVVDFNKSCFDVDSDATKAQFDADVLNLNSVHIDCAKPFETDDTYAADVFNEAGNNNTQYTTTLTGDSFILQANIAGNVAKGVVPGANEAALNATAYDPSTMDSFFDAATYVGAVRDANDTWYKGWTLSQQ
ncbi:hypothetical protein [Woodsholea maritima]|uniref:hypothetical protein n=1 Tax=Woodsholea maritima TaxID=240237 RepID=UPI00037EF898|nr:hypothetical protein [Woodsholea maritima]